MSKNIRTVIACLMAVIGLAACSSPETSTLPPSLIPAASVIQVAAVTGQAPNELLWVEGTYSPYTSAPVRLEREVNVQAHWDQSSTGDFSFVLANSNQSQAAQPADKITFELTVGPSSGSGDATLSPGEYVLKVTAADRPRADLARNC